MERVNDWKDVIKLDKELSAYYSIAKQRMIECDTYWSVLYRIKTWKQIEAYKPFKAMRKVQVAVDHVTSIGRNVFVPPWGDSEKIIKTAETLQKWGKGYIQMVEREHVNPTRVNALHSFLYGMWARRAPIFLKHKWPEKPSTLGMSKEEQRRVMAKYENQRFQAFPFRAVAVNPQNFMPDPNVIEPAYVIEHTKARASDVRAMYPQWKSSRADSDEVDYIQYWSADKCCIVCDNQPVTDGVEENIMGFIPYEWGYSGLGNEDAKASPQERIMGIVWPAISSLRAEARMKTAVIALAEQFTYGRPTISAPPGSDLRLSNEIGELDVVPDYYNYRIERPPMLNQDAWRLLTIADDDTNFYMTPKILEGSWPRGIDSGYQGAIQVGQARLITSGTIASIEAGLSSELAKAGKIIRDIIQDKVTVYSFPKSGIDVTHVSPDDFRENPVFFVKFEGETPEQMDRRQRIGLEMWVHRALSKETITRDYFNKDWIHERNQSLMEGLIESPEIKAALMPVLLRAFNLDTYSTIMSDVAKQGKAEIEQKGGVNKLAYEKLKALIAQRAGTKQRPVNPDNFPKLKRLGQLGQPLELGSPKETTL